MKIKDIAALASGYPTIMGLDQEILLIQELEKADVDDVASSAADFLEVVSRIWESHIDNGIFCVNKNNEDVFLRFARWLRSVEEKRQIPLAHIADDMGLSAEAIAKAMSGKQ